MLLGALFFFPTSRASNWASWSLRSTHRASVGTAALSVPMQRSAGVRGAQEDPVSEQLALFAADFESKILRPLREKRAAGDEVLAIQPVALGVSERKSSSSIREMLLSSTPWPGTEAPLHITTTSRAKKRAFCTQCVCRVMRSTSTTTVQNWTRRQYEADLILGILMFREDSRALSGLVSLSQAWYRTKSKGHAVVPATTDWIDRAS